MQRFFVEGTVHGGERRDGDAEVHVAVGTNHRAPHGAAKRARVAQNRRVAGGSQADHTGGWGTRDILDVRRRATNGGLALEALVDWEGDEWEPSWVPVNLGWMHADRCREARELYESRQPPAPAPAPPTALARARNVRARVLHARIAADVDSREEAELRRLEAGRADARDDAGSEAEMQSVDASLEPSWIDLAEDSDGDGAAATDPSSIDLAGASDDDDAPADAGAGAEDAGPVAAARLDLQSLAAARAREADRYAHACALRDAFGGAGDDWVAMMRRATVERRRLERHLREPLRFRTPQHVQCSGCGWHGVSALCPTCTRHTLGGDDGDELRDTALRALCTAPTLEALAGVAPEHDVVGDGSCWAYGVLAAGGLACAHLGPVGAPSRAQRCADVALRVRIRRWCDDNDGVARLAGGVEGAVVALAHIAEGAPAYTSDGRCVRLGTFGGDMQFVAVADILGCDIFTVDARSSGDAEGALYEHGVGANGTRGRWRSGNHGKAVTLSAAIQHCNLARSRLLVMRHVPGHWHVFIPVGAGCTQLRIGGVADAIGEEAFVRASLAVALDEVVLETLGDMGR